MKTSGKVRLQLAPQRQTELIAVYDEKGNHVSWALKGQEHLHHGFNEKENR